MQAATAYASWRSDVTARYGQTRASASQANAATGAKTTMPATSATAVAASIDRARASVRFQNACRKAAPRASARAEAGIGGASKQAAAHAARSARDEPSLGVRRVAYARAL